MTICIAALSEEGANVVVAADRMYTFGPPLNLEFEPPVSKIDPILNACVALGAGNSSFAQEIISRVRTKLGPASATPLADVADLVREEYSRFRDEKVEEHIIRANLGFDFLTFRSKGGFLPVYLQAQPMMYQQIVVQANQFNLTVEFVIAGAGDSGSHIFYVGHPGTLANLDKLGYAAVGSGAVHAITSLSLRRHTPKSKLPQALLDVYAAKRAAEVAPGVGDETEIGVVSEQGVKICGPEVLKALGAAFETQRQQTTPDLTEVSNAYGNK